MIVQKGMSIKGVDLLKLKNVFFVHQTTVKSFHFLSIFYLIYVANSLVHIVFIHCVVAHFFYSIDIASAHSNSLAPLIFN